MDLVTLINIVAAVVALLNALASQPIIPPEFLPYLFLLISLLNVFLEFLRSRLPANLAWIARPKR